MNSARNFSKKADDAIENCFVSYIVLKPQSSYIWSSVTACVVNIIFATIGTILNSLVLVVYWKSVKLQSNLSYFAIMVLSSVDLGVTVVVQPLFVLHLVNQISGNPKCSYAMLFYLTNLEVSWTSFFILLSTTIEKYLAIVHPIWHRNNATKRKFMSAFVLLWFINNAFNVAIQTVSVASIIISSVVVPGVVFLYTYIFASIHHVVRKRIRRPEDGDNVACHTSFRKTFFREIKMAKKLLIIVLLFFLCYLPAIAVGLMENERNHSLSLANANVFAETLKFSISTFNCSVFFWGNRELRREGTRVIKKYFTTQMRSGSQH